MAALVLLVAVVQFVLVGCGVTVIGSSELHNLAFGLALLALALALPNRVVVSQLTRSE